MEQPVVGSLEISDSRLTVRYVSGYNEHYVFAPTLRKYKKREFPVTLDDLLFEKPIELRRQFAEFDFETAQPRFGYHVALDCRELARRSFLEGRVAINNFAMLLSQPGENDYPDIELKRAITKLREHNQDVRGTSAGFHDWSRLWLHFYCQGRGISAKRAVGRIDKLCPRSRVVDSSRVLAVTMPKTKHVWLMSPLLYARVFRQLGVQSVLDLHPQTGSKAMACALAGIRYAARPCQELDHALNRGFLDYTGLRYEPYSAESSYDMIITDANMGRHDVSDAKPFSHQGRRLMACSDMQLTPELTKHNPTIIPTRMRRRLVVW